MTPETCPGCGAKLEPEMLACPHCPLSFPEDEPPAGIHPLRQTKAYAFLMPALFFAAIGGAVWGIAVGLLRLGEGRPISSVVPGYREKSPPAPTEPAPAAEGPEEAVTIGPPEPAASPRRVAQWRLQGRVYELADLHPVPGCRITFSDGPESLSVETLSDANGDYSVVVPALDDRGYLVALSKTGYSPAALDAGMGDVFEMPTSRRAELSRELSRLSTARPRSVQAYDARTLRTDFFIARRR